MRWIARMCMAFGLATALLHTGPAMAGEQVALPELAAAASDGAAARVKQDATCTRCHDESENAPILSIYQTKHGARGNPNAPTCQSCHGSSDKHVAGGQGASSGTRPAPDVVFKKGVYASSDERDRAGACLACHKGQKRSNWDGGKHESAGLACNDCHKVHNGGADKVLDKKTQPDVCFACHKTQRADAHKISSHPILAGKVVCSDCHNPHGSTGPKLLKKASVTETCYQCHAEKRGPFLFEHQPVTEDCTNCHNPHGSNITPLLKSRAPFLCQECHDGTHASGTPAGVNAGGYQAGLSSTNASGAAQFPSKNLVGRACMNCHSMVHGSNSPAGGFLQR